MQASNYLDNEELNHLVSNLRNLISLSNPLLARDMKETVISGHYIRDEASGLNIYFPPSFKQNMILLKRMFENLDNNQKDAFLAFLRREGEEIHIRPFEENDIFYSSTN